MKVKANGAAHCNDLTTNGRSVYLDQWPPSDDEGKTSDDAYAGAQGKEAEIQYVHSTGPAASSSRQKLQTAPAEATSQRKRSSSPLPPLTLKVKGSGIKAGQTANPFFDLKSATSSSTTSKPRQSGTHADSTSAQPKDQAAKAAAQQQRDLKGKGLKPYTSTKKQRRWPQWEPLWPGREDIHVQPLDVVHSRGSQFARQALTFPLPFEACPPDKGKGRQTSSASSGETLTLPQTGLTDRIRRNMQCNTSLIAPQSSPAQRARPKRTEAARLHTWVDLYRPRRAEEVLANRSPALYLRDWLRELQISNNDAAVANTASTSDCARTNTPDVTSTPPPSRPPKRRKLIQKMVDKAARRAAGGSRVRAQAANDWIVDDFIVDEPTPSSTLDGSEGGQSGAGVSAPVMAPSSSVDSATVGASGNAQDTLFDFGQTEHLTNCIVLHGPHGSGKTAAVYACAEELGFEVFELFPGWGKRSGKELNEAVGQLGRNHTLGGGTGGGAKRPTKSTANAFRAMMSGSGAGTSASTPLDLTGDVPAAGAPPPHAQRAAKQSLILIEEADILFEEDQGFWRGVVDLIARSRRPVVLTCNDLAFLQLGDLPYQELLPFDLPRSREAVTHLAHLVELATGTRPSSQEVCSLAGVNLADDVNDDSDGNDEHSADQGVAGGQGEGVDIRQAISQLQFGSLLPAETHDPVHGRNSRAVDPARPASSFSTAGQDTTDATRKTIAI